MNLGEETNKIRWLITVIASEDSSWLICCVWLLYRYHEADMRTGKATYWQLTSLQAFWPGLQVSEILYIYSSEIWVLEKNYLTLYLNSQIRFLLGILLLLIHHTVNLFTSGRSMVYYPKGVILSAVVWIQHILLFYFMWFTLDSSILWFLFFF